VGFFKPEERSLHSVPLWDVKRSQLEQWQDGQGLLEERLVSSASASERYGVGGAVPFSNCACFALAPS
jgi:hypothetical protein